MQDCFQESAGSFRHAKETLVLVFRRHSDRITSGLFLLSDVYLSTCDYAKNHLPDIGMADLNLKIAGTILKGVAEHYASLPQIACETAETLAGRGQEQVTADQLMSLSGLAFVATAPLLGVTNKWPWLKGPTGALYAIGGASMLLAAVRTGDIGVGLAGASAIYAGPAIAFHDVACDVSRRISDAGGRVKRFAKSCFENLAGTTFPTQMVGICGAFYSAASQPDQKFMYGYAFLWLLGAISLKYCYSAPVQPRAAEVNAGGRGPE